MTTPAPIKKHKKGIILSAAVYIPILIGLLNCMLETTK